MSVIYSLTCRFRCSECQIYLDGEQSLMSEAVSLYQQYLNDVDLFLRYLIKKIKTAFIIDALFSLKNV